MKIYNIEMLAGHKVMVILGRHEHVLSVAKHLGSTVYLRPESDDYFMDYPMIADLLNDMISTHDTPVVITTQSSEFLDVLLSSKMDFIVATVRKTIAENDDNEVYRLRVLSKEEARSSREDYCINLRV